MELHWLLLRWWFWLGVIRAIGAGVEGRVVGEFDVRDGRAVVVSGDGDCGGGAGEEDDEKNDH